MMLVAAAICAQLERRLHHPLLLGCFDLRLFPEPIFNITPGRIAALKKPIQKVSPTSALSRKFRAHARRAHLFKFFALVDGQHACGRPSGEPPLACCVVFQSRLPSAAVISSTLSSEIHAYRARRTHPELRVQLRGYLANRTPHACHSWLSTIIWDDTCTLKSGPGRCASSMIIGSQARWKAHERFVCFDH